MFKMQITKELRRFFLLLCAALCVDLCAGCVSVPRAGLPAPLTAAGIGDFEPEWTAAGTGIDMLAARILKPRLRFRALRVNLLEPGLSITMAPPEMGGALSEGKIHSVKVSGFARARGCAAAINAGPFWPVGAREGKERGLQGVFVTEGRLISPPRAGWGALVFDKAGRAAIVSQAALPPLSSIENAVGGFAVVLEEGRVDPAAENRPARHPRSAAGLSRDGSRLYLLAIDGRQITSAGATEAETARILRALGAESGLNLDGGGSTALALRVNGKVRILNTPIHNYIPGKERAVATCIGVITETR